MDWVKDSSDEFEKALDKSFRSLLSGSATSGTTLYGGNTNSEKSILGNSGKIGDLFDPMGVDWAAMDASSTLPRGVLPGVVHNETDVETLTTTFNLKPKSPNTQAWRLPEVLGNASNIFKFANVGDSTIFHDISGNHNNILSRYNLPIAFGELAIDVKTSSWSDNDIYITYLAQCQDNYAQGEFITPDNWISPEGSIINGSISGDIIRGFGGHDFIYGVAGDDLIRAGNGRDYIDGGSGGDEIHGDFGYNTYASQIDGAMDNIVIKSDTRLVNWWLNSTKGNNTNSQKSDIIEGLDEFDKISIFGANTGELYFHENIIHKGLTGTSISVLDHQTGNLTIEAHYVNDNLTLGQIKGMTTGYEGEDVLNNKVWSLNHGDTPPELKNQADKMRWINGQYEKF